MPALADKPKYIQVAATLREQILSGELQVGDRLPSYTEMYRRFGATTATAQRIVNLLEQEQLVERRSGSGVFVAAPRSRPGTGNIGFIGTASYNTPTLPFYQQLMGAMQQAATEHHKHLLYLGTKDSWDPAGFEKVEGVLLCNIEDADEILAALPEGLPCVSVLSTLDGIDSVGIDEYRAGKLATRRLLALGHRRIACLMERTPEEGRRRYAGYHDALLEAGIRPDPAWAQLTDEISTFEPARASSQPYRQWGENHMKDWLESGWHQTGCTAILAQNEVAAIGVMQVLQAAGLKIPADISVMGFDGTSLCELTTPRLEAVALPLSQIGAKAIDVLEQQIAGAPNTGQTITLPLDLSPGNSVSRHAS